MTTGFLAQRAHVLIAMVVIALGLAVLWSSAWNEPLYPPDEGRYSSASSHMAEGGSWLIPVFEGGPHLTKPPLTYWAQAVCLRWLGRTELAVRLPSLAASSLLLVLLLCFGWKTAGPRVGILAAAVLSIMPLFVAVGRLAITDPMLNLFWFAALAFGYLAIKLGRIRWAMLMWMAVAFGLITKGPLALTPVTVLAIWLIIGQRSGELRRLRIPLGLPLAGIPLALWVALVLGVHPEAREIWQNQIFGRMVGTGDHSEAFWYYTPIFLIGLLPGTAMLVIPGWNLPWRDAQARFRAADPMALWALAIIVPFALFSIMAGKLPHYLLPLCAPMALLSAITLERWLSGEADHPRPGTRPPEVVAALTVIAGLVAIAALATGICLDWRQTWKAIPLAFPLATCVWMWMIWKRRPDRRAIALMLTWLACVIAWIWAQPLGQEIRGSKNARDLVTQLHSLTGQQHLIIFTYGFRDPTIEFYNGSPPRSVESAEEKIVAAIQQQPDQVVLLVDAPDLGSLPVKCPTCAAAFHNAGEWTLWSNRKVLILRPNELVSQ